MFRSNSLVKIERSVEIQVLFRRRNAGKYFWVNFISLLFDQVINSNNFVWPSLPVKESCSKNLKHQGETNEK